MTGGEILAPAGTKEALIAAVRCGANAVYLGAKELNARRNAGNFDDEELKNVTEYCHARGVKVFLTLNTLARDGELNKAARIIALACRLHIDGLIVQDLGVAALARKIAPEMFLSASTQMSVHTPAGLRFLAQAGFSRAVLARELSFDEICGLLKDSPIELEVFVHGALCMCVSGQCYLSGLLGGRSGNRGLCAQPCRLPFSAPGGTGFDLSLKDLSVINNLHRLSEMGVASFKIEGRMKRPEYVAAAVSACRNALDGKEDAQLSAQLRAVFSRSGFTDGYFKGELGREMFGTRQKEDVVSAAPALASLARRYEKETPLVPVSLSLTARAGEKISLSAAARGESVSVKSEEAPEPARSVPTTAQRAEAQLKKCGGTPFYPEKIDCNIENGLSIPASSLNRLRREALDGLFEALGRREPVPCAEAKLPAVKPYRSEKAVKKYVRLDSEAQFFAGLAADKLILPLQTPQRVWEKLIESGYDCAVELPRALFGMEEALRKQLRKLKQWGVSGAFCGNLGAAALCKEEEMPFSMGIGSNIFNTAALNFVQQYGAQEAMLSFELTTAQARAIGGSLPRGLFAYGRLPLMLTRNCPVKNGSNCAHCARSSGLTDRKDVYFPVRCNGGASELLNSCPLDLADRMGELDGMDFALLWFTTESRAECAEIMRRYRDGTRAEAGFTRGFYDRGVE